MIPTIKIFRMVLAELFDDDHNNATVDLSTARMKSVGAKWIVQLYEHLADSPHNYTSTGIQTCRRL